MKNLLIGVLALSSISAFASDLNCSFKLKYAGGDDFGVSKSSQISVNGQDISMSGGINSASVALSNSGFNYIEYTDKNLLVITSAALINEEKGDFLLNIKALKGAGAQIVEFDGVLTNYRPMVANLPLKNRILPSRSADLLQVKCELK